MAKVASELGVQGQLLGGIVPTHGPEEPLMPDMCWVTETVLVARHRSMVPDAGALPPQGISLVLATIGNCPDAATICLAAANTERVVAEPLPIRPQRLQTAESGASSAGLLAVILCASTRAIRGAVAPLLSAPMVDGTTREVRLRRTEAVLGERGWIGIGKTAANHGDHVLRYRLERRT